MCGVNHYMIGVSLVMHDDDGGNNNNANKTGVCVSQGVQWSSGLLHQSDLREPQRGLEQPADAAAHQDTTAVWWQGKNTLLQDSNIMELWIITFSNCEEIELG